MRNKTGWIVAAAVAVAAVSTDAQAQRGSRRHLNIIYWQAPTILNPYLSGGTKDSEAASLVLESLAGYDENGIRIRCSPPRSRRSRTAA